MLAIERLRPKHWLVASATLCVSVCSGCLLGPNYRSPPSIAPAATQADHLYRAPRVVSEVTPPINQWWLALGDTQLTQLIALAFAQNPHLAMIEAQLTAARAQYLQRRAEQLPQLGATGVAVRANAPDWIEDTLNRQPSPANAIQTRQNSNSASTLYNASFDASWELDLFGRQRRAREQARASADATAAHHADAMVQLAAEVGQLYVNYRSVQARRVLAATMIAIARQRLELTEQQATRGIASALDIERMKTQFASQQAASVPLDAEQEQLLDQLAMLVGMAQGSLDAQLTAIRPIPTLPDHIAVDRPAAILQRRPDIRQAERTLAAATAQVGQALTEYFPDISLHGSIGLLATTPSQLGHKALNSAFFPLLRWSVFDFGRTRSHVEQAKANVQAYDAAYRQAVLAALNDANTSLSLFGAAREQYDIARTLEQSAVRADTLMQQRANVGAANLIDVLDVQRQRLTAQDSAVRAQAQLVIRFVALQKSLGLGWSPAPMTPPAMHPHQADAQ